MPQTIPGVHPQYHGLIGVAALVVLARELNIPLNDPANPSQSFLNDLSTTLLAPQWAPSAYMLQTGMQARGEDRQMVHRLVMSAPCRTAVFLGHVLPHGAVQYGPYKLAGSEVVLSLPWRRQLGFRFSEAVQRSCTFIADCRVSYLQKQIGPSPSIGHGPRPRRRFSAAAARAVIDARRVCCRFSFSPSTPFLMTECFYHLFLSQSHHNPCLLLHQNDHLEPLSYLRAGEHGYVFLTNPTLSSRQPFIPSDEVIPFQDLIPPRRWIHLFVQSADRYVEYLGVYERVQPSRVWMWHRSTPDEWEHLSQQVRNSDCNARSKCLRKYRFAGAD